jgi:hypothetical protein
MAGGPKNVWEKIGVITAFILAVTGIVAVLRSAAGRSRHRRQKKKTFCVAITDLKQVVNCPIP